MVADMQMKKKASAWQCSEETTDAMRSLNEADRSRTAAAKRLTAFLLLDAAFHSKNS